MSNLRFAIIYPYSIMPMHVVVLDDGIESAYHVYDNHAKHVCSGFSRVPGKELRLRYCVKYAMARGRKYVAKYMAKTTPLLVTGR